MKLKVTNESNRIVNRLGHAFEPHKAVEIEINHSRDKLTLEAAKGLKVEVANEVKKKKVKKEVEPEVVLEAELEINEPEGDA